MRKVRQILRNTLNSVSHRLPFYPTEIITVTAVQAGLAIPSLEISNVFYIFDAYIPSAVSPGIEDFRSTALQGRETRVILLRMNEKVAEEARRQLRILETGLQQSLPEGELLRKLERSLEADEPLRVKFGVDPTSPDLHLGHAVPLRKLHQFQKLGHLVYLIIGDFTGRVGDPSQRDATRPHISAAEVEENARTYTAQAFRVLDESKTVLTYNSEWLAPLTFEDLLGLTSHFTVARLLERDDFSRRYKDQVSIGLHEFLYPVMQAYDSVAVKADVEMGGTDQVFNLLAGRELQRALGQEPQAIVTVPILVGLDGEKKMSKSLGNHIALTDSPEEMFGKVMSISDELMVGYFKLATELDPEVINSIDAGLKDGRLHPAQVKRRLAAEIVALYWSEAEALEAQERFDRVFKEKEAPEEMPEFVVDTPVRASVLLVRTGLARSLSDARRLVEQRGVKINGEVLTDADVEMAPEELSEAVIQKGKRHFVRIKRG